MHAGLLPVILLCVLTQLLHPVTSEGSVTEVEEDRKFRYEVNRAQVSVVFFYLTYCNACHGFSNKFGELVRRFRDTPGVRFLRVDGTKLEVTSKRNNVHAYPTVLVFNQQREDKKGLVYKGKKEVPAMFAFIDEEMKYSMPKLVSVQSNDYVPLVFDKATHSVMLFLTQGCRGCLQAEKDMINLMTEYQSFVPSMNFLKNDASVSKVLARIYDVMHYPTVWLFPNDHKEGTRLEKGMEMKEIAIEMDYHFGLIDRWNSSTFGQKGRVVKLDDYIAPLLDDLRGYRLKGSEIESLVKHVKAMNGDDYRTKIYNKCIEYFLPKNKGGVGALKNGQRKAAEKILANFEKKKRSKEDNAKLIAEWNIYQYFKTHKYEVPEGMQARPARDEL